MGLFPGRVAELINAFTGVQFPVFPDLLKIWCGGNLFQNCSFCASSVKVAAVHGEGIGQWIPGYPSVPTFSLLPHMGPIIFCGGNKCLLELQANTIAWNKWCIAVLSSFEKLDVNRCDYCFKLANEVHRWDFSCLQSLIKSHSRCSKCLTKNWCSKDCQRKDWEEKHQEFCKSSEDGRKVKGGAKERARFEKEKLEERMSRVKLRKELREEDLGQLREAFQKKEVRRSKKK